MLNFAAYLLSTVALWALSLAIYVRITPYPEFDLARQGNVAASLSLGGTAIGLALPLTSLAAHAVSLTDLLTWAGISLCAQIVLWAAIARLLFPRKGDLHQAMLASRTSVGVVLGTFSIGLGLLNAGSLTY